MKNAVIFALTLTIVMMGCSGGSEPVGQCVDETCMSICADRECGPSTYNSNYSCGECEKGQTCIDGSCVVDGTDAFTGSDIGTDSNERDTATEDTAIDTNDDPGTQDPGGVPDNGKDTSDDDGQIVDSIVSDADTDVGCVQQCGELECGPDPVCQLSCGDCFGRDECISGKCVCQPFSERQCGDNGCGESFGDCPNEGEICVLGNCVNAVEESMVKIAGGTFKMGCGSSTGITTACKSDEKPEHDVTLSTFFIDKTEVTQGEYQKCVEKGDCDKPGCGFSPLTSPNRPVVCVTWKDAAAFCAWMSKRLPTEAEWEFAARGGMQDIYPWGSATPDCTYAHMYSSGSGCGTGATADVCSKSPKGDTDAGLCDMAGNVWEWVNDWYDSEYYKDSPEEDPQGPKEGLYHLTRGGGWDGEMLSGEDAGDVRCMNRNKIMLDLGTATDIGFRCAR